MKKLFSLILALMLCILPAASMAEMGVIGGADGPTTMFLAAEPLFLLPSDLEADALAAGRKGNSYLTVTELAGLNTGVPAVDTALTDLFNALGIYGSAQGDEAEFGVTLSDVDVLNAGFAVNGEDAYIQSNLLGDTIVINLNEVGPVFSRLLDVLVLMGGISEDEVVELKAMISELQDSISMLEAEIGATAPALTEEDLMQLNFTAILEALEKAAGKVKEIDQPIVPRNCDYAASGIALTVRNKDLVRTMEYAVRFVKDNPVLKDMIGANLTGVTDLDAELDRAVAAMKENKILDGECTVYCYFDEAGSPVYATIMVPLYEVYNGQDFTTVIEAVYTRQTVAQGVSHVLNVTVADETLTVDALVGENTLHMQLSAPGAEPVVFDAVVEGHDLKATLTAKPDDSTAITLALDGTYLCTDTEYKLGCKFTFTEEYTPVDTAAPSINGMTLPGFETYKPKAETNTMEVGFTADYVRNGVDFEGVTDILLAYNDIRVGLQAKSWTTDPTDSIMSGNVVRPAELDDNAFTAWFVQVVNNLSSWAGNLLMALPESLLTLIMQEGMI